MARVFFCGIDFGTTNTKAVLVDSAGHLLDSVSMATCPARKPDFYGLFGKVMGSFGSSHGLSDAKVVCSITAQGGSFALLDENFKPVSRLYSWTENSEIPAVKSLMETFGKETYYRLTGWPPSNWLMSCKMKELFSNGQMMDAAHIATLPEMIHARLSGKFITDITNAQITGLCDFQNGQWDQNILNWIGSRDAMLPEIETELTMVLEDIRTEWGTLSFAASSHDQYAAMEAANLHPNTNLMLATGTAWVINSRTTEPVFDEKYFLSHPGRDIRNHWFGNIVSFGAIGKGFETLLHHFKAGYQDLNQIESAFTEHDVPCAVIDVDMDRGMVRSANTLPSAVKRYMEWSAAKTLFVLELYDYTEGLDSIVMTGGAGTSRYWPQVIADVTHVAVQVFDFPEFTAYGAALHARSAYTGIQNNTGLIQEAKTKTCYPVNAERYRDWYEKYQKPYFERQYI